MMDCPACGRWHDAGGAPWCAAAGRVPGAPADGGPLPLQEPGPAVPGPDPRDLELFAEGRAAYPDTSSPYAQAPPDDGTLEHPVVPGRARHGRGRRRRPPRARLAALAAAGVAALSGGLVAANVLGGDGRPDADRADERPDAPFGPLPTNSAGTPDAGTPTAASPPAARAGAPDRAQRSRPSTAPPPAPTADPATPGPSPGGSSTEPAGPSSTASSRATVSAPSGTPSGSPSSSPSGSPTPTPTGSESEEGEEERGRTDGQGDRHPNG
ncbi:hypothetical protein [Streptomyces sp. WAC 06738]|uniref:hypothetical protein n=1 Tax=Streptomyces sp. WAC 06738 TaxID=2203210 RepID=UPI001F0C0FE5|nr:hypothetical protein [Streptomyces sp. WAC 06738]